MFGYTGFGVQAISAGTEAPPPAGASLAGAAAASGLVTGSLDVPGVITLAGNAAASGIASGYIILGDGGSSAWGFRRGMRHVVRW